MKLLLSFLLVIYLVIVFQLLFVNVGKTDRDAYHTKKEIRILPFQNTYQSLKMGYRNNFGPNGSTNKYYRYLAVRNIAGNLVLFFPFGILIPLLFWKINNVKKILLLSALISFLVEVTQYILVIGVFDIDDIILNTAGAILGFLVLDFIGWSSIYTKRKRPFEPTFVD